MSINTNDLRIFAEKLAIEADQQYLHAVASELDATRTERNLARSALSAAEARAEAAEARVGELEEALLQHNERLRSAIAVADRNGAETNWKTLRGELHYTAAEYHELVNSVRTLKGATDGR